MLTLRPVSAPRASLKFDLVRVILDLVGKSLKEGDVLVVSSKYIAISEGRKIDLRSVRVSPAAKKLARAHRMDPRLCELVVRESEVVLGGVPGFLLTNRQGLLTPNAGIDKSNVEHGKVVLYPRKPEASAARIRDAVKFELGIDVGVVVSDSRLMPTRRGTTGVALAASGIEAVVDMRGRNDLFGNVLRVTSQAVADDLTSAAQLLMGESDEAVPIVVVSGLNPRLLRDADFGSSGFSIPADECVYLRSLGFSG